MISRWPQKELMRKRPLTNDSSPLLHRVERHSLSRLKHHRDVEINLIVEQWLRRDPAMERSQEKRWDPLSKKFEPFKRRALRNPIYVPAQFGPAYLDKQTILRFRATDDEYILKKQKLDDRNTPIRVESILDNAPDVNTVTGDNADNLESRRSDSLESLSDHVFSSPNSRSPSSSRSSSPARTSEANDKANSDPRDQCHLTDSDQSLYLNDLNLAQVPRIPQQYWPTSISLIDQPIIAVGCLKVGNVACRVPLTTINGNHSNCNNSNVIKPQSDEDNLDQASFTISNNESLADASSPHETDAQSNEGDRSTNSKTSSNASDYPSDEGGTKVNHDDKLEAFIKEDVLRTDPAVADEFYQNVLGKLEYSSPEYPDPADCSRELSLLDLLEFEAFSLVQHSGAPTECPGSSTGPSPSSSGAQRMESASKSEPGNSSIGSASGSSDATKNGGMSRDDPNQLVKSVVRSSSSQGSKAHPLRCIHNAIAPAIFSVNEDTLEKYRACSGPGWNSIQHLKEHMQNVHTKQVKKANTLQCNRCQDDFPNADELKSHELNVDCAIRCPDCPNEFSSKALRQEHQKEHHSGEADDPLLRELDDVMWKQIKEKVKLYTDVVKNKKGKASGDPDSDRERWVLANTAKYEAGRSKTKFNSKLDLGQWYTIFTTLAPDIKILDHPFYDYGTPRSDYAQERILFIHETMIDARVTVHGLPPSDFDLQREWYREALRDSLRVAAKTKKVSHIKGKAPPRRNNTLAPSPGPGPGPIGVMGYNVPMPTTTQMPHTPTMNNNVPGMAAMAPSYHSSSQQHTMQHAWQMTTNVSGPMPDSATPIDFQYFESPGPIANNRGQSFLPPNFFIDQGHQDNYDFSGWEDQQGGP